MDKESIIGLQKIDCNCNDCYFLIRNIEGYKSSLERHHKWQLDYFNTIKAKRIERALWWKEKMNDIKKHNSIMKEVEKMRFQFDRNEAMINFGTCSKLNKQVSFLPNTIQLETQECFEHRADFKNT